MLKNYYRSVCGIVAVSLLLIPLSAYAATATLGDTTIGGATDSNDSNFMNAIRFTVGASGGTAQSMSVYIASPVGTSPNNQYAMAIYGDSGGAPGALLASTNNGTVIGNAWNTLPITATLNANTTYWLVYNTNGTSDLQNNFKVTSGSSGQITWRDQTFGTWPTTFGATAGSGASGASIYVTYTTGTAQTSTPTPTIDSTAPSTPGTPTVSNTSSSALSLTWTASTDAVGVTEYKVERCTGVGCTSFAQIGTPSGTAYTDTNLSQGISYTYRVRASDAVNNLSAYSASVSGMTQAQIVAPTPTPTPSQTSVPSTGSVNAATCSQADVQNAINNASNGNIVNVPAGNCTWSRISLTKGIHLKGAGATLTKITNPNLTIEKNASYTIEVSGFAFSGVTPQIYAGGAWTAKPYIIHDMVFNVSGGEAILSATNGGLIYKSTFNGNRGYNDEAIKFKNDNDSQSWFSNDTMGTRDVNGDKNVYVEDIIVNNMPLQTFDFDGSSRVVVRHNTFNESGVTSHGPDTGRGIGLGTRHWELYDNTFVFTNYGECTEGGKTAPIDYLFFIRGGTGVIANNIIPNVSSCVWGDKAEIKPTVMAIRRSAGETPCSTAYPVPRQFGQSWANGSYVTDPVYIWGNTGGGNYDNPLLSDYVPNECGSNAPSVTSFIVKNRDYKTEVKPGYTKYPYPHPLRSGVVTTPTPVPTPQPTPTPVPTPTTFSVTVAKTGQGTITSVPSGVNCGTTCSTSFPEGTSINFTAAPAVGYTFKGWSGICYGIAGCTTVVGATALTANFVATVATSTQVPPPVTVPVLPQGNTGISAQYPNDTNIQLNPSVLFADDFESYTSPNQLTSKWSSYYQGANTRIASETGSVFSGSKSLEFTLPVSSAEVSNALVKNISPTQDTLFVRVYTKFDSGYHIGSDSNHNGIRISAKYPGPGKAPNGSDFFLYLLENAIDYSEADPGYTRMYSYHPEQRSQWGDISYPDGKVLPYDATPGNFGSTFVPRSNFIPKRDTWYSYEMMVKANTPGQRDGRAAIWIDGNLVADFQNLRARDVDTLKIDQVQLELHSQAGGSARINKKWYDNLVVAKSYIGPMSGGAPTPSPTPVPTPAPVSTKFAIGDRVQVSSGPLNVRATANTTGTLSGTQSTNALGTIVGGPTLQGGYNWWQVNFDSGVDGYAVEDFMVKYVALIPTPAPSPIPQPTPSPLPVTSVSVVDYGADPSGLTSSDSAFTKAFAAAATGSNIVYVPCGNYLINTAHLLAPKNDFRFYSLNQCATLTMGASYAGDLFSTNARSGVSIYGMRIVSPVSTFSNTAINIAPVTSGDTNTVISDMFISGPTVAIKAVSTQYMTVGLDVHDTVIEDTRGNSVVLQNVSNFNFQRNKVTRWYTTVTTFGDGINYDMNSNVSNWVVKDNVFTAGPYASHAISQGPYNPQYVIVNALFENNISSSPVVGITGQGGGFGIECNNCKIRNNTFSAPNNAGSGWRNCLEVYSSSNVEVTNNTCDNGMMLMGAPVGGANINGFLVSKNEITTKGQNGNNTMSCIIFTGLAGSGLAGGALSNIDISDNKCNATNAGTTYGVLGIAIGRTTWASITNLTVNGNTIAQPSVNQAIRIINPSQSLSGLSMTTNIAPRGLAFTGQATTYSNNIVSSNNFSVGGISDSTGSSGSNTFNNNTLSPPTSTPIGTFTVSVTKVGQGTVTTNPSGITCGITCSATFPNGTNVSFTASPAPGYKFNNWSGLCYGVIGCISVSSAPSLVATFIIDPVKLPETSTTTPTPPLVPKPAPSIPATPSTPVPLPSPAATPGPAPAPTSNGGTAGGSAPSTGGTGSNAGNITNTNVVTSSSTVDDTTNIASAGKAYRWHSNKIRGSNANRVEASGLNDNNLDTDVQLNGGASERSTKYEAGGVIWTSMQTIDSFTFINGDWITATKDGSFSSALGIQFTSDGVTWSNGNWVITPSYAYNSKNVSGTTYTFKGTPVSVLGVRVVGKVRTTRKSSYWANIKEIKVNSQAQ